MVYHIRAEHKDGSYEDFSIGGSNLLEARRNAELRMIDKNPDLPWEFDWRGQVVFVNREGYPR